MSKPSTPVRRSKVGPGRPGSAGGEIPLTASMEVLTPDPCVPPLMAVLDVGRSSDLLGAVNGGKPRTPGSAPISRTRSTDGRRSGIGTPHEVISLTSTTSKSFSANHLGAHPPPLPIPLPPPSASPACSVIGAPGAFAPQSPYAAGPGGSVQASTLRHVDIGLSQASSRFNPVTEGDDDASGPYDHQQRLRQQQGGGSGTSQVVVLGGGAAAVAQRAATGTGGRRYADSSVASSQQQPHPRPGDGDGGREGDAIGAGTSGEGRGGGSAAGPRYGKDDPTNSDPPGTPGSVASGRVGGVFFTDLHRSFASDRLRAGVGESQDLTGALEEGDGEGLAEAVASRRSARASTMTSRLNPMQSPSGSSSEKGDDEDDAFAEYAGEAELPGDRGPGAAAVDPLRTSTSTLTEYGNPLQTPQDSRLATPLLPLSGAGAAAAPDDAAASRGSLLHVIHDLYVTDPEPPPQPEEEEEEGQEPSRPATAATEAPVGEGEGAGAGASAGGGEEGDGGPEDTDDTGALAASRAAVAALAVRVDSQQSKRRSELGEYMTALQELKDDSGGRLVELPADWGVMLERLFRQRRSEFATLQGWLGPRRFEDLPINQLPSDHPDPRVEEGLARIRELDSVLNDKLIAALISHRETFPDQWAEQERKRLDRHSKGVEEALKRERQKRLRAARISRAVTSLDGPASTSALSSAGDLGHPESESSMRSLAPQSSVYSRLYALKPEEEALVEQVMQRNDEEGAAINPFDLESAATYGIADAAAGSAGGGGDADGILADPDDVELDLDFLLPSSNAGSCCPTPSAAPAAPMLRPLSARLADPDGGGGSGLRPLSAASSFSLSRPGTSSGAAAGAGGLSPIAAAALRGHPVLLAWAAPRASAADGTGGLGGGGGLLPSRVYEDPRAAARALRAINARLAAFESEHLWDESGSLADFKNLSEPPPQPPQAASASGAPGTAGGGGGPAGQAQAPRPQTSPPRSVRSAAGGPAPSVSGVSVTEGGQRDYLREERLAKELATRERDVDAALRNLKTGEVVRLGETTLKALVEQCRRLQELNEQRRKIEEAEAAARRAQQQRQQLMANSPRGRSSDNARTPKGPHGALGTSSSGNGNSVSIPGGGVKGSVQSLRGQAGSSTADGSHAGATGGPGRSSASAGTAGRVSVSAGAAAGGGSGHQPRQNSAGNTGGRAGAATAAHPSSAGPSTGGSGVPASRRASDPTASASTSSLPSTPSTAPAAARGASSSGAAAAGGGASSGGGGGSGGKGVRASSGVSGPVAAWGSAPPKPKPGGGKTPTAATSLVAQLSVTSFSSSVDVGLPPPPPPPPP